jgi:hypothetical protein
MEILDLVMAKVEEINITVTLKEVCCDTVVFYACKFVMILVTDTYH